ncbi:acyl-CoA dehydrogenase family protein [Actinomadura roseirufa]|uniref:acyl-CoA dehydrogenase family protein n=1 Tax=Actinomadura roseirufa TaxID=2094049 RepID=UPI001F5F9DD3|nr:acyl-CoA dehydrogenase family protein [Actinomadura roseirufa]
MPTMSMGLPDPGVRRRFRDLARETVAERADDCHEHGRLDLDSWKELADAGIWRLPVPVELGGDGGSWWDFVAAFEGVALGGRDLGFVLSMVAHAGLIRSVLAFGTPEQRARWLPRLLGGEVGATALTETTGGSDVARIQTRGRADGEGHRLDGEKTHITNGPVADVALILGRVPELGRRDLSVFLVDLHQDAVSQGPAEDMLGNRTSPTGPIRLRDARVEPGDVLGRPGAGLETVYNTISLDRLLYGVLAAAYLEPVLDDLLAFAQNRDAFKHKIADFQYVQGRLTDTRFGIETARWVSYGALDALLRDSPHASLMCSTAKFQAGETLRAGTENILRVLGHRAYMAGSESRRLLDALGTLIAGGTAEMQRKNVFNQMVRLAAEKEDAGRGRSAAAA